MSPSPLQSHANRRHARTAAQALTAFFIMLSASGAVRAAIITVGASGGGCTHGTIQAALDDAAIRPGFDVVRITRTQPYTAQQLIINTAHDLDVDGGYATCASSTPDGTKTVISGAGGAAASVFTITGTRPGLIQMHQLRVTGGDRPLTGITHGGGINFVGSGELRLIESAIDGNTAQFGGGVRFDGDAGGGGRLVIGHDTLINGNQAERGGGIDLDEASLTMDEPGSSIVFNQAVVGGGLFAYAADNGNDVRVHSSGYAGFGAIDSNEANVGGAVSLRAHHGASQRNNLNFTLGSGARIANNVAFERAGAINTDVYNSTTGEGRLDIAINGGVIESNVAPAAAAIYLDHEDDFLGLAEGARLFMRNAGLIDNVSADGSNAPTAGPIIIATDESTVEMTRVRATGNRGGPIVRAGEPRYLQFDDSLFADNTVIGSVLSLDNQGVNQAYLRQVTIAGNTITPGGGESAAIATTARIELNNSIIWQPGHVSMQGPLPLADDVLASEVQSLGTSDTLVVAPPRFVDPEHGDYRPQAASPAVDFSGRFDATLSKDIDGRPRGVDLTRVTDVSGPADLGAFELQELGNLVLNPGFQIDTRLWQAASPGATVTRVAAGANSEGSVTVSLQAVPGFAQFDGLKQCVRIPGAGNYQLSGQAYGAGADAFSRDIVSLHWILRADSGGENCTGAITAEGDVAFPPASAWRAPTEPALIEVTPAQWTPYTNVEIFLRVREGSFNINATMMGHFDGIVLEATDAQPSGLPFADGFE
jgi:hypothetical protein